MWIIFVRLCFVVQRVHAGWRVILHNGFVWRAEGHIFGPGERWEAGAYTEGQPVNIIAFHGVFRCFVVDCVPCGDASFAFCSWNTVFCILSIPWSLYGYFYWLVIFLGWFLNPCRECRTYQVLCYPEKSQRNLQQTCLLWEVLEAPGPVQQRLVKVKACGKR